MTRDESVYISVVRQDIVKLDVTIKGLIQEIRGHAGSQAELDDLGAFVRSKITALRDQIDELKRLAQEQDAGEDRLALSEEVSKCEKTVQDIHKSFRNAILTAQLTMNSRDKDELIGLNSNDPEEKLGNIRSRNRITREMMIKKSSQLTDDLLSVTRLIRDNTEKSTKTVDRLVESSQTIGETREELKTMGSVVIQARKILNKYGRRENTDKLLIFLGLVFFLASCLVVVRNRFIF